jgi:hypothetical protein
MIGIFDDGLPWRLWDLGIWDSLVGLLGWCLVIGFLVLIGFLDSLHNN